MRRLAVLLPLLGTLASPVAAQDATWQRSANLYPKYLSANLPLYMAPNKADGSPGAEGLFTRSGWAATDNVVFPSIGTVQLSATRRNDYDRKLTANAIAKGSLIYTAAEMAQAKSLAWNTAWLQSPTADFGPGKTWEGTFQITNTPHFWAGGWAYAFGDKTNSASEIDAPEITVANGKMTVRTVLHGNVDGQWITHGCSTVLPVGPIKVKVDWTNPAQLIFSIENKEVCRADVPANLRVPQYRILSGQVGGLARASQPTDGTATMTAVNWTVR